MFLYLFIRIIRTKDGDALTFLKFLTLSLSLGSFVVFIVRYLSERGELSFLTARAIAITNPILLVAVALYLSYLFQHPSKLLKSQDSKNINTIKHDVKEVKKGVEEVKEQTK
jgi:uncharacterized protein with PQ loop repeat